MQIDAQSAGLNHKRLHAPKEGFTNARGLHVRQITPMYLHVWLRQSLQSPGHKPMWMTTYIGTNFKEAGWSTNFNHNYYLDVLKLLNMIVLAINYYIEKKKIRTF